MKTKLLFLLFFAFSLSSFAQSFDEIGLQHNAELRILLPKLNPNTPANQQETHIRSMMPESMRTAGFGFSDYSEPKTMISELLQAKLISSTLYNDALDFMNAVESASNHTEVNTIVEYTLLLKSRNMTAQFEAFLSVAKHSAKFWDPAAENGVKYLQQVPVSTEGRGPNVIAYDFDKLVENVERKRRIKWLKVLLADATGALSGGVGGAVIGSAGSVIGQLYP